ncbi:MAG: hypothetical protein ABJQ08_17745 [Paracoccaceae bacterium]
MRVDTARRLNARRAGFIITIPPDRRLMAPFALIERPAVPIVVPQGGRHLGSPNRPGPNPAGPVTAGRLGGFQ